MIERSLLAIVAHPDDESFGMGGTLARYAAEGARVTLICATRGEAGVAGAFGGYAAGLRSLTNAGGSRRARRRHRRECATGDQGSGHAVPRQPEAALSRFT